MTVFVVAQLQFRDRMSYDRYQARFLEVFSLFAGRLLAADEDPQLIEGEARPDKVVIMSFPSDEAFRAWSESPEYRKISRDRVAGAESTVLLVQGLRR